MNNVSGCQVSEYQVSEYQVSECQVSKYQDKKGYKKLKVWQKAQEFVLKIYEYTYNFPKEEMFGLTSQIRRSALSVTANIVEGQASSSKKEFLNFLNISNRSLVETEYLLETAKDLKYLLEERYIRLEDLRFTIGNMLYGLIRSIKNKIKT